MENNSSINNTIKRKKKKGEGATEKMKAREAKQKEEETTPERKRAKAMAVVEKSAGAALGSTLHEPRPAPTTMEGAQDHGLTSPMALATYGTLLGRAHSWHTEAEQS